MKEFDMMKFPELRHIATILLAVLLFASCEDYNDLDTGVVETDQVDMTTYAAVGNSLTAGLQSGALYESAQEFSFPALVARAAKVNDFEQPMVSDPGIGGLIQITDIIQGSITRAPADEGQPLNAGLNRPYNNLGIPGALTADYLNADGNLLSRSQSNPFYELVLRSALQDPATANIHSQLEALQPTLVSFYLGNNDILQYATSGGIAPFTAPSQFQNDYSQAINAVNSLDSSPAILVYTIPDVTTIPFLTSVGPQLSSNLMEQGVPQIVVQKSFIEGNPLFPEGNSDPVEQISTSELENPDESLVTQTAQDILPLIGTSAADPSAPDDAVEAIQQVWIDLLLSAGAISEAEAEALAENQEQLEQTLDQFLIGQYEQTFGSAQAQAFASSWNDETNDVGPYDFDQPFALSPDNPMHNQFVLDGDEITISNNVVSSYNSTIQAQGATIIDANGIFADIVSAGSITVNGVTLAPEIGSFFSFDGVHPSSRGYALLAKETIEILKTELGAEELRDIDISEVPQGIPVVNEN